MQGWIYKVFKLLADSNFDDDFYIEICCGAVLKNEIVDLPRGGAVLGRGGFVFGSGCRFLMKNKINFYF